MSKTKGRRTMEQRATSLIFQWTRTWKMRSTSSQLNSNWGLMSRWIMRSLNSLKRWYISTAKLMISTPSWEAREPVSLARLRSLNRSEKPETGSGIYLILHWVETWLNLWRRHMGSNVWISSSKNTSSQPTKYTHWRVLPLLRPASKFTPKEQRRRLLRYPRMEHSRELRK